MESQLVVLLGRDDDAFDDQNDADSDQSGPRYAEADLDKDVQRSVFRIPGVLHLSLPAADDEVEVEKMQKKKRKKDAPPVNSRHVQQHLQSCRHLHLRQTIQTNVWFNIKYLFENLMKNLRPLLQCFPPLPVARNLGLHSPRPC